MDSLGFAGGEFVALAGTGHAAAGCAPENAHPAEQHTFSEAPHIPARTQKSHHTDSLTPSTPITYKSIREDYDIKGCYWLLNGYSSEDVFSSYAAKGLYAKVSFPLSLVSSAMS